MNLSGTIPENLGQLVSIAPEIRMHGITDVLVKMKFKAARMANSHGSFDELIRLTRYADTAQLNRKCIAGTL